MHTVIETPAYLAEAEKAGLTADARFEIVSLIAANPEMGISLGSGYRKVRVAGRGFGKSGGYRVITFYKQPDYPAFLITVFGKGEKDNLSKAERNELGKLAKVLIDSLNKKLLPMKARR